MNYSVKMFLKADTATRLLATIFLLLCMASSISAQDSLGVSHIRSLYEFWGQAHAVAMQGDLAYVATGYSGLKVVNLMNDDRGILVQTIENINAHDVALDDQYAYVIGDSFYIFDIADNLSVVGVCDVSAHTDLKVVGDYAYIAAGDLVIMDVSDRRNPIVASILDTPGSARAVAVDGDLAFIADNSEGLRIVDVSDRENPEEIASINPEGYVVDVTFTGEIVALANERSGVRIIDVSNPAEPEEVGLIPEGGGWNPSFISVVANGDLVYAVKRNQLCVIDISNPARPFISDEFRQRLAEGTNFTNASINGNHLCCTYGSNIRSCEDGVISYNIEDPHQPTQNCVYATIGCASKVFIKDNLIFLPSLAEPDEGGSGTNAMPYLRILSGIRPDNPRQLCSYPISACILDVEYSREMAYLGRQPEGLILDMTNPNSPEEISEYGAVTGLELYDNYLFVIESHWRQELIIFDVSDSTNPVEVNRLDSEAVDFRIQDEYAYLAIWYLGLMVLDLSNPEEPEEIAVLDDFNVSAIDVNGNYAFLSARDDDVRLLWIIDISDPTEPTTLSVVEFPDGIFDIDAEGDFVYLAMGFDGGLVIMDVSDPENPVEAGHYNTPGCALGVAAIGQYAYVADGYNFGIYDCSAALGESVPPQWVNAPQQPVEAFENEIIQFDVVVYDGNGDDLAIEMDRGNLPDEADFSDHGDGRASFIWQTGFEDAGEYQATITASDGENDIQCPLTIIVHNVNRPPVLVNGIPDIVIDEDSGQFIIAQLDTVFIDPDGEDLDFALQGDERLGMNIDENDILSLTPALNFNCDALLTSVLALNQNDTVAVDFRVTITEVNDQPTEFELIAPSDSAEVYCDDETMFRWEASIDPDNDAEVRYCFYFVNPWDWNSGDTLEVEGDSLNFSLQRYNAGCMWYVCEWWVEAISGEDTTECSSHFDLVVYGTGSIRGESEIPLCFALAPPYPNPFNSTTTISYSLPAAGNVALSVYDLSGREVARLVDGVKPAGTHEAVWTADGVGSGVYVVALDAGGVILREKVVLVK